VLVVAPRAFRAEPDCGARRDVAPLRALFAAPSSTVAAATATNHLDAGHARAAHRRALG